MNPEHRNLATRDPHSLLKLRFIRFITKLNLITHVASMNARMAVFAKIRRYLGVAANANAE